MIYFVNKLLYKLKLLCRIKSNQYLSVILLLLIGLIFFLIKQSMETVIIRFPLESNCQLHVQPCFVSLKNHAWLLFSIRQKVADKKDFSRGFLPNEILKITAEISGIQVDNIIVFFVEKDSYSEYRLRQTESHTINSEINFLHYELYLQNNQSYYRDAALSVCISTPIEWIALIRLESGNKVYELPFEFETSMSADEHEV